MWFWIPGYTPLFLCALKRSGRLGTRLATHHSGSCLTISNLAAALYLHEFSCHRGSLIPRPHPRGRVWPALGLHGCLWTTELSTYLSHLEWDSSQIGVRFAFLEWDSHWHNTNVSQKHNMQKEWDSIEIIQLFWNCWSEIRPKRVSLTPKEWELRGLEQSSADLIGEQHSLGDSNLYS